MSDQTPEPLPDGAGEEIPVKVEGSVTDGVFRIDIGIEDTALVTLQFGQRGAEFLPTLLALIDDGWEAWYENIIETFEAQVAAAAAAEETK